MSKPSKRTRTYRFRPTVIQKLFSRFRSHLRAHRRTLVFAAICMVGAAAMEILRPWPIKVIFDGILIPQQHPGALIQAIQNITGDATYLLAASALSILAIATIGGLLSFGQAYLLSSVGQKVVASIRQQLHSHIHRLSQSFHDTSSTGDLLARLTGDVRMMRDLLVTASIYISARFLALIGTLIVMALMDWRLTLVALAVLPMLALTVTKFGRKIKGAARKQRRKESKIAHVMTESISAITVVQAYSREAHEEDKFARQNSSSAKAGLVATRLEANLDRIVQIFLALGTCAVIWYGVIRVQAGVITPGDLLVFAAYLTGLYKPVRKIASLTGRISKATVCGERILAILDIEPEIKDEPGAISAPSFKGRISFENVTFAYTHGPHVLRDANLVIEPGETVAFVSGSGSGKTTAAHLILRFYDPRSGAVKIDDRDIRDYTVSSLRNQISVLLQESVLFNTSIRDNIAYGRLDATEEDIIAAAKDANADSFIRSFPDGYDTVVGERGATLSGGQRQRIAIARAMVRNAPIVILDEPLTGLDAENEKSVMGALANLTADKTCLVIAHDRETALLAKRIIFIEDCDFVEHRERPALAMTASATPAL